MPEALHNLAHAVVHMSLAPKSRAVTDAIGRMSVFEGYIGVLVVSFLVALAWRNREAAVLAIETRDGVRFLVEAGSPFKPIRLLRSPGFTEF